MIKLLNIYIEGFCSIVDPIKIPLNQGTTVLIKGPNGRGKTTMFSAITWALYGKNLKATSEVNTWKKVQPKSYKGTRVEIFIDTPDGVYKVIRCYKYTGKLDDGTKGGSQLIISREGQIISTKGKTNLQAYINRHIMGMPYPVFMASIMFGQGMKRLIQESNTDKKKLFEEIFQLTYFNTAKDIALEEKDEVYSQVTNLKSKLSFLEREQVAVEDTLEELKESEDNYFDDIRDEIKDLEKQIIDLDKKLSDDQGWSKDKVKKLEAIPGITQNISKVKSQISNSEIGYDWEELVNEILGFLDKGKIDKAKSKLEKIRDSYSEYHSLNEKLISLKDKLSKLNLKKKDYDNYLYRSKSLRSQRERLKDKISSLQRKLEEKHKASRLPEYKEKLTKLQGKIESVKKEYQEKKVELDNYLWVIQDPLGNQGIKAYLFDSCLAKLNDNLARYTEVLGFRIEFSIDLSSARKEFVTLIEMEGEIVTYDELSGGEKQLCNIAMAFALHDSLTMSTDINMAFLDEVFESVSADNIELVISLIKEVFQGKTLFLITHHESLPFSKCKTLSVTKTDGRTSYSEL